MRPPMTPIQALSDVCSRFCIGTKPNITHDDACTQLRQIVQEWVELRMRDAGDAVLCGATLPTWNNDYVCEQPVGHVGAHQGRLAGTLHVWSDA